MHAQKFLLVDDDRDDTEIFAEAIGSLDTSITFCNAYHGKEALDRLAQNEIEKPDIIFLDINMPIMNGWQFLERIKEDDRLKEIPVIMYSTSSRRSDFDTALSSGALCFLTKPDTFVRLKNVLQITASFLSGGNLEGLCDAIREP